MKKIIAGAVVTSVLLFSSVLSAFSATSSVYDISSNINKLTQLAECDFNSMINKSDLIGNRAQNFDMLTSQYKNDVLNNKENMTNIIKQIEILNNSLELSESDKIMQIGRLYQEVDSMLYVIDSRTSQYLYSIARIMPTITYQRYFKKFKEFYNQLDISNNQLK